MTEEKKEVVQAVEETKDEVAQAPEPSPVEVQAREQGWVSKEEWVESGRDADEWRPAKEFVDRGELYKTIHSTKRDLKQTQAALTALQRHHQYVFERAHKQALADLKAEKRAALRNEDFEAVEAIDEQIEKTQEEFAQERAMQEQAIQATQVQDTIQPAFNAWQERNPWYHTDEELREFADATGIIYASKNKGVAPQVVLDYVEKSVRRKFPEKFGKRTAPNPTAPVSRNPKQAKVDGIELDDMEREIMDTLVKSGAITREQYISDLKKVKKNG